MLGWKGLWVGGRGGVTVMLMQFVHHSPTVHQEYTNMMVKMRLTMIIEMRVGTRMASTKIKETLPIVT